MSSSGNTIESGRSVERVLEIGAPVERVWRALTEAQELERWFSPRARSTPGEGGLITLRWEDVDWEMPVLVWEPPRRLVLGDCGAGGSAKMGGKSLDSSPLRIEYELEGHGGTTTLRMVHSGFGLGAEWDDAYDGVSCGWSYELRSLRHALERHPGQPRRVAFASRPVGDRADAARAALLSILGIDRALREDERIAVRMPDGAEMHGRIVLCEGSCIAAMTLEELNDALFRVEVHRCGAPGATVWVWLSAYGVDAAHVEAFGAMWTRAVDELVLV